MYTLSGMRLHIHTLRSAVAVGLSVWLAVLACFMGCALPSFASVSTGKHPSTLPNSAEQNSQDLMADMEGCPHHHQSDGGAPAKRNHGKPVRGGNMSCCPVEVTVASKPDVTKLGITVVQDFLSLANVQPVTTRFYHVVDSVPLVLHSGRVTLLGTHLLRI